MSSNQEKCPRCGLYSDPSGHYTGGCQCDSRWRTLEGAVRLVVDAMRDHVADCGDAPGSTVTRWSTLLAHMLEEYREHSNLNVPTEVWVGMNNCGYVSKVRVQTTPPSASDRNGMGWAEYPVHGTESPSEWHCWRCNQKQPTYNKRYCGYCMQEVHQLGRTAGLGEKTVLPLLWHLWTRLYNG